MAADKESQEELLLDWNLDRLSIEERAILEEELKHNADLREMNLRLCKMLAPLDHWTVSPTPMNLSEKVLQKIKLQKTNPYRSVTPSVPAQSETRAHFLPMRNFIAAAACILLLVGVFIPGLSTIRSRSRQAICANHLGSIYRGTATYQEEYAGSLPYAGRILGASWLPQADANTPYASNSRHVYLLVKYAYVQTKDFICPCDQNAGPMNAQDIDAFNDFISARNISYDTINLAGVKPNLRPSKPVAYMSDVNPLFVGARFNEKIDPETTNSPAHRGRGQTVLILDGSTNWLTTPYYGKNRDNLWLISNIRNYNGTESPIRDDDVQLVPGCPAGKTHARDRY